MKTPSEIRDASLDEQADVDLDELTRLEQAATPGPWEWWTSCSYRRLTGPDGKAGGVAHAFVASDGVADITIREDDMALIAALRNAAPKLLALARRALARPEAEAWRCSCCGELKPELPDSSWRMPYGVGGKPGELAPVIGYQHNCPGNHPMAGWFNARNFGAPSPDVHRRRSEIVELRRELAKAMAVVDAAITWGEIETPELFDALVAGGYISREGKRIQRPK